MERGSHEQDQDSIADSSDDPWPRGPSGQLNTWRAGHQDYGLWIMEYGNMDYGLGKGRGRGGWHEALRPKGSVRVTRYLGGQLVTNTNYLGT